MPQIRPPLLPFRHHLQKQVTKLEPHPPLTRPPIGHARGLTRLSSKVNTMEKSEKTPDIKIDPFPTLQKIPQIKSPLPPITTCGQLNETKFKPLPPLTPRPAGHTKRASRLYNTEKSDKTPDIKIDPSPTLQKLPQIKSPLPPITTCGQLNETKFKPLPPLTPRPAGHTRSASRLYNPEKSEKSHDKIDIPPILCRGLQKMPPIKSQTKFEPQPSKNPRP